LGKAVLTRAMSKGIKRCRTAKRFYTVDHRNRKLGNWKEGAFDELPTPGVDLTSSIDLQLQLYGEKLMKRQARLHRCHRARNWRNFGYGHLSKL
jgi:hypothetical protein